MEQNRCSSKESDIYMRVSYLIIDIIEEGYFITFGDNGLAIIDITHSARVCARQSSYTFCRRPLKYEPRIAEGFRCLGYRWWASGMQPLCKGQPFEYSPCKSSNV